jgi:transcriptional regulator
MSESNGHLADEEERRAARRAEVARDTRAGILDRARRRHRILELRAAGLTEQQIADRLSMTQSNVSRALNRVMQKWGEEDEENVRAVRNMKLFELDQLKRAVWANALQGDVKAVREAMRIIELQAKISGASAPIRIERRTTVDLGGIDTAEIDRMETAWLEAGGEIIEGVIAEEDDGNT